MDKGYAAECFAGRYITKWSAEQCCMFLSRRNTCDTFEYEFKQDGECIIVFLWKWGDRQSDYRRLNVRYRVSFRKIDDGTILELAYIADERDEFLSVKLDAIPCHNIKE